MKKLLTSVAVLTMAATGAFADTVFQIKGGPDEGVLRYVNGGGEYMKVEYTLNEDGSYSLVGTDSLGNGKVNQFKEMIHHYDGNYKPDEVYFTFENDGYALFHKVDKG